MGDDVLAEILDNFTTGFNLGDAIAAVDMISVASNISVELLGVALCDLMLSLYSVAFFNGEQGTMAGAIGFASSRVPLKGSKISNCFSAICRTHLIYIAVGFVGSLPLTGGGLILSRVA